VKRLQTKINVPAFTALAAFRQYFAVVAGEEDFVGTQSINRFSESRNGFAALSIGYKLTFFCEARMHSPGHRWTSLILVVSVALTIGCRGSRPFSQFVQVTQESDTGLPDVEPPRQRLATTKPRIETEVSVTKPRRPDDSPHLTRQASSTANAAARSKARQDALTAARATKAATQALETEKKLAQASAPTPSKQATTAESTDPKELMSAFSDYPPEVQREALRRLVAATSLSAEKTTQPKPLDSELAKNILDLPKLPAAKNTEPEVPPTRIASKESASPAVASLTDTPKSTAASADTPAETAVSGDAGVQARVTDLVTTELEPTSAQTISDSDADDKTEVKTASLSGNDDSMVARAAVEPVDPETLNGSDLVELSDEKLFAALLKRLATPTTGESEAQRNSRLIKLRHLMVLSGDPDTAVEKIEGMPEAEQEYLRHQLLGLWTMVDPNGHPIPSRRFTSALPQLREATKFAAAATDSLEVQSLAFCTEIESYGQIKTFPGNRFDAGQQIILYCEIENFTVDQTEDGFETHLQGSYDVYNSDNEKVVSQLLPADKQVSANYLRDYFIAYQMHLPQQLSAGTYRLQLTMEDVGGKKYGQANIPFEIAK
jgi:hypothetical protein